jgi:hypothetical protein
MESHIEAAKSLKQKDEKPLNGSWNVLVHIKMHSYTSSKVSRVQRTIDLFLRLGLSLGRGGGVVEQTLGLYTLFTFGFKTML